MIQHLDCFGSQFHHQEGAIIFLEHPSNKPGSISNVFVLLCTVCTEFTKLTGAEWSYFDAISVIPSTLQIGNNKNDMTRFLSLISGNIKSDCTVTKFLNLS